jgi:hypothetical protein
MPTFSRREVDDAFAIYYSVGPVLEDWPGWVDLFVDDCFYVDHFWGPMWGKDEVKLWIAATMKGVPEIYTALDWYAIDDDKVIFHMENRRDNPDPDGPPYFDFPGLSVIFYAGDGKWRGEEDFWDLNGARRTTALYRAACEKVGITEPRQKMTRKHWPDSPAFARTDREPQPSWIEQPGVPGIQRPSQLHALLDDFRARRA